MKVFAISIEYIECPCSVLNLKIFCARQLTSGSVLMQSKPEPQGVHLVSLLIFFIDCHKFSALHSTRVYLPR